jgi:AraC-like DNA-binding protein/ligand-binding sensor protein
MSPNTSNIIIRREIEPLLLKAQETLLSYERASAVTVSVLDQTGHTISAVSADFSSPAVEWQPSKGDPSNGTPGNFSEFFCSLCRKFSMENNRNWMHDEYPCTQIHIDSISRAQHSGGVYIYTCDMGFTFWTCPLSSGGRLAGALIAGMVLGVGRQEAAERLSAISREQLSREEAAELLEPVPERPCDEIQGMAQLLFICAEQISKGPDTYHETLKRRAEQQSQLSDQIEQLKTRYPPGESVPGYPLGIERQLLASLRRGDNEAARKALDELLGILFFLNPDNFKFMQYRAIELVVLLSRAAVTLGNAEDMLLEINNQYLQRIQESKTTEELIDILHLAVDSMTGQVFSFKGARHASALRKAERYIWGNFTRKISLQEVASASGLSAPYFSTVFKEEMGENLSSYLNRLRVDRAASMLTETVLPLSEIAGSCGFEDQSWFSKIFKTYTGKSPGKYRDQNRSSVLELPEDNLPVNYHSTGEKAYE